MRKSEYLLGRRPIRDRLESEYVCRVSCVQCLPGTNPWRMYVETRRRGKREKGSILYRITIRVKKPEEVTMEADEFEGMTVDGDAPVMERLPHPSEGSITPESVLAWESFLRSCFEEYTAAPTCGTFTPGSEDWERACLRRQKWRGDSLKCFVRDDPSDVNVHHTCWMALDTGVPNTTILATYALLFL
jgi:hypothetical protein